MFGSLIVLVWFLLMLLYTVYNICELQGTFLLSPKGVALVFQYVFVFTLSVILLLALLCVLMRRNAKLT